MEPDFTPKTNTIAKESDWEKPGIAPESPLMKYFKYDHLPPKLQKISKYFYDLGWVIQRTLPENHQSDKALEKLLEAKDCAVRSVL